MSTRVITVRSPQDYASAATEGAKALEAGQLVGFATETVYGIAAPAFRPEVITRLRELKSRPETPFSLHLGKKSEISRYVREIPIRARWLIAKALPGPVTLLLPTGGALADPDLRRFPGLHDQLTRNDVLGIRVPDEPVAQAMLSAVDGPVVAPSANLAGDPSPRNGRDVLAGLADRIDLLIDVGETRYGKDSTIVRFDEAGQWSIVRQGVYGERMIQKLMRRRICFVCTGNTCRSPMAAGIAKALLAEQFHCKIGQLRSNGVEIHSAGVFAQPGCKATREAIQAAKTHGATISRHKSRQLTPDLIESCDAVYCMTRSHLAAARQRVPQAADKLQPLDETQDVPDPIGGGADVYKATAEHIATTLRQRLTEGTL
jgi:tRNA threonylcarbamoyl adenosine modification protein (Sua5/YciO/YrdC/YwlC family)